MIWDEILNDVHQDRASTAEVFLNAQQRLADAEARFEDAMHRIHSEWKAKIQAVADMVEDVHNEQNDKIEELDHFVRFKMVETDAREKEFAQLLEEAERKRQAYFSSLLGKVTSKASKLIGFGRNNASKGAN